MTRQAVPYVSDPKVVSVPLSTIDTVTVSGTTYSQAEFATGVNGLHAVSSGGSNAIFDVDLAMVASLTTGLGPTISDIVLAYALGVHDASDYPTAALYSVTFGATGAEHVPTVSATAGGTLSYVGLTATATHLPKVANTSTNAHTGKIVLGTPVTPNTDNYKLSARVTFPLADGGTVDLLGVFVHSTNAIAQ